MTDLIEALRADHAYMAHVLDVIDRQLGLIEGEQPVDLELLQDAVYFMTEYPDLFHHARENLMYRRLSQRHRKHRAAVRDLERAHATLAALGLAFREVVEDAAEDLPVARSVLLEHGKDYLAAQRDHIEAEERRIFPWVLECLDEADWRAIDDALPKTGPVGVREHTRERFRTLHDVLHGGG